MATKTKRTPVKSKKKTAEKMKREREVRIILKDMQDQMRPIEKMLGMIQQPTRKKKK